MDAPATAQRWPRYWFKCPHCSLRKFEAQALVRPAGFRYGDSVAFFSFWCPNCGQYSALRHPALLGLGFVVSMILFMLVYHYFAWLRWLVIVPALMFGLLWSYAGVPLLTRLINRYTPLEGPPR